MKKETTNDTPQTTAIVAAQPNNMTALQVCANMQAINALGQTLAQSGFFGQVSASTATAALVNCFLEGLTPLQYKSKYHTFDNGQTGVKSDYIQRQFHLMGGKWKFNQWDAAMCDMTFTYQGETMNFKVTLDEFKENGVACGKDGKTLKTNWVKYPREMLKARCMATAIRAICPEAMEGLYTQEEVADFPSLQTVAKVSPSPIAGAPSGAEVDSGICPCGSVKGKAWGEIPTETLEKILETPASKVKALTDAHRAAIMTELARRETAEAEVVETEVVEA